LKKAVNFYERLKYEQSSSKKMGRPGRMGKGMDEFKLPSSDELSGKELIFRFNGIHRVTK